MPSATAKRKCPDLIFVKPRFDVYRAVSLQIRAIFAEYTPIIEPLSLDEAYLDVTNNLKGIASATQIAETIRKMGPAFVERLPVEKFHGVGPVTTAKMNRLGIKTGFDLKEQTLTFLQQHFGKPGPYYYWIARGVDERPVRADRIRKSLGAENTFSADIFTFEAACDALQPIIEKVWRTCEGAEIRGRTVTLKVKYADFQQITRSRTGQALFSTRAEIEQLSYALLEPLFPVTKGIRLLGMTLSSLGEKQLESEPQLSLSF